MKALLGKKLGMTQIFDQKTGVVTPVTVLQMGPCPVVQVKTRDTDGYEAVQIGFGDLRSSLATLPRRGHFRKAGVSPRRWLRELRVKSAAEYTVGDETEIVDAGGQYIVPGFIEGHIHPESSNLIWLLDWKAAPELRMPHGGKRLSHCDRDAIKAWIRQGAKKN